MMSYNAFNNAGYKNAGEFFVQEFIPNQSEIFWITSKLVFEPIQVMANQFEKFFNFVLQIV